MANPRMKNALPRNLVRGLAVEQKYALANALVAQRATQVSADAVATESSVLDATGRAKLLAALPWVIGGLGAVAVLAVVRSRRRR
jgi:hypothetical protein